MNKFPKEQLDMLYEQAKKVDDVGLTTHILQELKEYRDLEEQGLLLKLPCKVGDTLYFVSRNKIIEELIVLKITYQDKFIITFRDESNDIGNVSEKYIGKTVFLTKEEAEEKLKELNISERN